VRTNREIGIDRRRRLGPYRRRQRERLAYDAVPPQPLWVGHDCALTRAGVSLYGEPEFDLGPDNHRILRCPGALRM
jgi:hypothetical protein